MSTIGSSLNASRYHLGRAWNNALGNFKNNKYIKGPSNFLNQNSAVAKVSFLILMVIVFILLLRIGTMLLTWALTPSKNPVLVKGMKDATKYHRFVQDPAIKGSKTILRSVNEREGIAFTWSVWLFITGWDYKSGQRRHVFSKGSGPPGNSQGIMEPNNAPGLYLHHSKNALVVLMNTYNMIDEEVEVNDIPLNKWVNVMIRVAGDVLDVYINGTIAVRHKLSGVAKQNYGDVFVNLNGGYTGYLADLSYFDYDLNTSEIASIVNNGPNMTMTPAPDFPVPHYLSLRWFIDNATQ